MSEKKNQTRNCHLSVSQYLGEISALCFLHLPTSLSTFPYLLAGTGPQLLLYDLGGSVNLIESFRVFEGIRVHGITSGLRNSMKEVPSTTVGFEIAVFGEKRVKLFNFCVDINVASEEHPEIRLDLVHSLPRFSHWVLDVSFLKGCAACSREEGSHCVAIGCSDNSVRIWDIVRSCLIVEVHSPERCLLYSLRLWGDNLKDLRIASGTIFNEIIVWKVVPQKSTQTLTNTSEDDACLSNSSSKIFHIPHHYEAVHISRLVGHEGSIFRIVWSSDGSTLVSVSDDRSARIWAVNVERKHSGDKEEVAAGPVLFGHTARVWDCCISSSLVITAGEDCSCHLWGLDGKKLKVIKEHIGRGVWRCLYDSESSLLITAGFDSAIKVHQLCASFLWSLDHRSESELFSARSQIFTCHIPNSSQHIGLMDSKSEYVRCLHLKSEDVLYVATNNGYLYLVKFFGCQDLTWTKLVQVPGKEGPIICMDLLSKDLPKQSNVLDDWVAFGDGKGNMTVARVVGDVCFPEVDFVLHWSAEKERQLLGTYWCKALGHRFIFTSDPRGNVKLWQLVSSLPSVSPPCATNFEASLIAEFSSCLGFRIMCLDASFDDEVLLCGDLRGNLVIFPLLKGLLLETTSTPGKKISSANYFKGAHGISTVSSVSFARLSSNEIEICSTGGDGCICFLEYDEMRQCVEFVGMKQVKELSLIQSVVSNSSSPYDLANCGYAVGFTSTDFIVLNLTTEAKVVQVPCGGWRRPHSFYLGVASAENYCFVYVKDESIYVHRQWLEDSGKIVYPQNLHIQFHGREMHSLCFVSGSPLFEATGRQNLLDKSSWIATGCEDGTVRLTRYNPGAENWLASKLLGEHVGGSAVRSICFVSKMHIMAPGMTKFSAEDTENPYLLISVGAKRVLTTWVLRGRRLKKQEETRSGNESNHSLGASTSLTFKWLATDMPLKHSLAPKTAKSSQVKGQILEDVTSAGSNDDVRPHVLEKGERVSGAALLDKCGDDDWRYLAVTAFLVKCIGSRLNVCFVVVASSDASLVLRALVLPHRLWFDVASLVPLSSPVLALQHVAIPVHLLSGGDNGTRNLFFVISGATDGSIAFWDLTQSIESFVTQLLSLDEEGFTNHNLRPRTGRGSQGGRRWRCLRSRTSEKRRDDSSIAIRSGGMNISSSMDSAINGESPLVDDENSKTASEAPADFSLVPEMEHADSFPEIHIIQPFHVLKNVHQSGVNCLHVSKIEDQLFSEYGIMFSLASGGDDQALHFLKFSLLLSTTGLDSKMVTAEITDLPSKLGGLVNSIHYSEIRIEKYDIKFLPCHTITSAHTSAVKGVWTDGTWTFSTGLDQRLRCWLLDEHCKLTEQAHLIITVPEPEALDVRAFGRNCYQIAVAGRGMQMVEFSVS